MGYRFSTPLKPSDLDDDEVEALVTSAPQDRCSPGATTVLRAMTDDGAFRVITTRTRETVRGSNGPAQGFVGGATARMFGDS